MSGNYYVFWEDLELYAEQFIDEEYDEMNASGVTTIKKFIKKIEELKTEEDIIKEEY